MISVSCKEHKHKDVLECREVMAMGDQIVRKASKKGVFELRGES